MKRQTLTREGELSRFTWDDGEYVLVEVATPTRSSITVCPKEAARAFYRARAKEGFVPSEVIEVPDPKPPQPPNTRQLKLW